ncbi:amino acid kinase family protein [Escherichia coli]|uniref:amino acid kinase family protein n=1 Tax=Escherichia coli TaxID=562 RepID=UPI000A19C967|nr:carbamate kinase [Escherichia coli]
MENKPTLVIALGGNALLKRGEPLEAEIQRKNIDLAAKTIAQLTQHWRVVLVHGNGPQVGLLALQNSAYAHVAPYPLDILGAESQGMIGYMLQQALKNQLPQREISVLLTQVEVDAIQTLIAHDHLVICNGGGGVPVVEKADGYHGIEAVIDKDLSAALLASQIHADALLILTDADAVYLDWGKPTQRPLAQVTPELLNEMQFDAGSMGPKVTACAKFVSQCRGIAGIGSLADGPEILAGDKGTLIRLDTPHNHA